MSEISEKLAQRIKELRQQCGISQQRLAELLQVSRPTISQIENRQRRISADELIKLSEIFGLSVESLLDFEKQPEVILREGKKGGKVKPQIRINVPQKNLEKFKEIFLYPKFCTNTGQNLKKMKYCSYLLSIGERKKHLSR